MPVTYTSTSRKGVTYHLCQAQTMTGKPRYYFSREPSNRLVERIPEGFRVSESVNGIVSLVRDRPSRILEEEVAAVEEALRRHPRASDYRIDVKTDRIQIYERVGPSPEELLRIVHGVFAGVASANHEAIADLERRAQFAPVLRFILEDEASRTFRVDRMCYRSGIDEFIPIGAFGPADRLAAQLIPKLGTDELFDLC